MVSIDAKLLLFGCSQSLPATVALACPTSPCYPIEVSVVLAIAVTS